MAHPLPLIAPRMLIYVLATMMRGGCSVGSPNALPTLPVLQMVFPCWQPLVRSCLDYAAPAYAIACIELSSRGQELQAEAAHQALLQYHILCTSQYWCSWRASGWKVFVYHQRSECFWRSNWPIQTPSLFLQKRGSCVLFM